MKGHARPTNPRPDSLPIIPVWVCLSRMGQCGHSGGVNAGEGGGHDGWILTHSPSGTALMNDCVLLFRMSPHTHTNTYGPVG